MIDHNYIVCPLCKSNTLCNTCQGFEYEEESLHMLEASNDEELINISSGEDAFLRPNDYKRNQEARA